MGDKKVLIVDDNPDDREAFIRALKKVTETTYRYVECADGMAGVDMIKDHEPDCVLLDYSLPGRNGLDILRIMQAEYPFLPVIMLTGQGNEAVAVQAIKAGAQNYLTKSDLSPNGLHLAINSAIEHCALNAKLTLQDEKIRDREAQLIASNLELERFAYVASHDLQEPMRMVASFTGLLKKKYADQFDDKGQQYMDIIIQSSERMQALIRDLLEYSRIESETSGFQDTNCTEILRVVKENIGETIKETDAIITADGLPVIYVNPVRLTRLLQNLIGNAIKYRDPIRSPEIHVGVSKRNGDWLFSVSDNGIGMKEEYLEQIFVIFKRLHTAETYQGTGIGLAVCKKIVDSFGGRIWADSKSGEGSTFYFTVPEYIEQEGEGHESNKAVTNIAC